MKKSICVPIPLRHQEEGSAFLASREAAGLFDEQGLGKTKQLIDAVLRCVNKGLLDGAVVICPNHLKSIWKNEVAKHAPNVLSVVLGAGKVARRHALRNLKSVFYIVNYEAVAHERIVLQSLLRFKKFALVLDESHRIKSPEATVTKAVLSLRREAKRRFILTGTPVANKPDDLWSQIYFLDGGASLGATFEDFVRVYGTARKGYFNLNCLNRRLGEISIRRIKSNSLKLPRKDVIKITVPLTGRQEYAYIKMRDETRLMVESMNGEQINEQADCILKRLTRLVQLASNPKLVDPSYNDDPAKFHVLDRLVDSYMNKSSNTKTIIWSSFVDNVNVLRKRYNKYGAVAIHGRISRDRRELALEAFHNDPRVRILVANPAAAREGLTLTQATIAIYVERTFNLVDYLQSQDRIHRLGQTKRCKIVLLIATRTVDEYVDYCLEQKLRVAKYVEGDKKELDSSDKLFQKPALIAALLG